MTTLFRNDWLIIPAIGILAFVFSYLWSDRFIAWLRHRSLGQREEVIRMMEMMMIEVDHQKLTIAMVLSSFGLGFLVFLALWPNIIIGLFVGGIVTIAGWSIPKLVISSIFERRAAAFVNQMVDGMTILANGVKSGLSVDQSMARVVEAMPNPISQEFKKVLNEIALGRGRAEALNDLGIRIPKPDVQMFVTSVNILLETGGNLAETFETITTTIRERQKVEKKIEALTAQGLTQGIILTLVPFAILIGFAVLDYNYIKPLFTTTLGLGAFVLMIVLQVIGGLAIKKIVKINV